MLYLDGISLNKIKTELETSLKGKGVNKVVQTSSLAVSINFGKQRFILSCFPSLSLCYLSDTKEDNLLEENSSFALNLKKYIVGSTLISINQLGYDRILIFTFSKLNELGEVKIYNLYFEMMGKHSNLILTTKENKVLDSIKRFSIEENPNRVLFPGIDYSTPSLEKKLSPLNLNEEEFLKEKNEKSLLKNIEGLGKTLANSLTSFENLKNILKDKIAPKIFFNEHNEIILATVLNIEPREYNTVITYSSFQELINFYLNNQNLSNTFKILKDKLTSCIKKEIKKSEKVIISIKKDLEEKKNFDRYRELGDILAASLYSLKKGMTEVELYDFYNDCMCTIPLDPLVTPQINLEKIYKKYNKLKKGMEYNQKRLIEISDNLKYFLGVESFINNSDSKENLKLIEEELSSQGYLKVPSKTKHKKNIKKQVIKTFNFGEITIDGILVRYGRNNLENDALTTKYSHREDMWFHCKDMPGTHAVVNANELLSEKSIYDIAVFCGQQSKLPKGTKLTVDYTQIKYLNKPKGAKPGFVTYKIFKSIVVTL
ncbi:NFACT family protein [Cetobacterium sp. 2G large]|uniref:Rqc2 family fibronectin-binding protein n=1 Tax=Cetobacterium sp. 2G large TaxID=2759680 RepID=UPI00163CF062|nr:NFACT family protein [Cetobacterium sp. 2G large]MBC2853277.1 NFACT family protein [Cetobacterium sp. 2G large]